MVEPVAIFEIDSADEAGLQSYVDFELAHEPLAEGRTLASMRRRLGSTDSSSLIEARIDTECVGIASILKIAAGTTSAVLSVSVTSRPDHLATAGDALFVVLQAWALEHAPGVRQIVRIDGSRAGIVRFWSDRGFAVVHRLELLRVDLSSREVGMESARDTEVSVVSLADRPDLLLAAWQVRARTWGDVPGNDQALSSFEVWSSSFSSGRRPLAGAFVAIDDSDSVIGLTTTAVSGNDTGDASTDYTGVISEARGKGVALALKRHQVEWCRQAGYGGIETVNHEDNAAMRNVNQKLGFSQTMCLLDLERASAAPVR